MKKVLYISLIILGIISILIALYFFFNIYFVISVENEVMYDGFGYRLVSGTPNNPKTIWGYVFFVLGISIIDYPRKKLIEMSNNRKD